MEEFKMRKTKAIIAMLIIICMVMALVPFRVFAALPYANLNVSFENTYNERVLKQLP